MSNVQVDDRDPGTEYIGPWGLAGALQEYLGYDLFGLCTIRQYLFVDE